MSTRSNLIIHRADGKWCRIYCHFDGYLEGVGRTLFDHYTSQKKADQLVKLGDLSILGEVIGRKHPFDAPSMWVPGSPTFDENPAYAEYKEKYGKMCLAYGRDRGEKNTACHASDTLFANWPEADTWSEFVYVWCDANIEDKPLDPCWWVADPDKGTQDLVNLGDALQGKITVRPAVKAFGATIGKHSALTPNNPDHGWTSIR